MEDKPENGQAGAEVTPIEVTSEMIEAGVDVLQDSGRLEYCSPTSDRRLVSRVFQAMEGARI